MSDDQMYPGPGFVDPMEPVGERPLGMGDKPIRLAARSDAVPDTPTRETWACGCYTVYVCEQHRNPRPAPATANTGGEVLSRRPDTKHVVVADELVAQLRDAPSEPVTLQITEREGGELEFVATRHDCPPNARRESTPDNVPVLSRREPSA